jgi:aryl-alcohol dehydrogenase-like predicted oxidoreductase
VGSTLVGATRVEQLDDSLAAAGVALAREALDAVNKISKEILYPLG